MQEGDGPDPFEQVSKEASEKLEGNFPGLGELIDELNFQGYGRGIGKYADDRGEKYEIKGYILPLRNDQSRHLVMFKDGYMCITEPYYDSDRDGYRRSFSPGDNPKLFMWRLSEIKAALGSSIGTFHSRVIYSNNKPEDVEQINQAVREAINLAEVEKSKRDQAREDTARNLVDELKNFLNPPKAPPELPPPDEPSQLPPGPTPLE